MINQWPAFALSTSENSVATLRNTFFTASMIAPHTLYAIIYAGECYRSHFCGRSRTDELLQLQSKREALKHLRKAVEESNGVTSDEMLLTMALLTLHGTVRPLNRPPNTIPLYRDNEFYSSVEFERTQLNALRTLVAEKGGLDAIKLHGLSNMISM
jgi:hypothetical protein